MNLQKSVVLLLSCLLVSSTVTFSAMFKPNPIISRGTGVTVKVSSGDGTGLNNKKFGMYETKKWAVTDNSWAAIKVVDGSYPGVFLVWGCADTTWSDVIGVPKDSCSKKCEYPVDYEILTSANSTDGSDGDWTSAVTVTGNTVNSRGHLVPFDGMKWIKMKITKGKGSLDEIEVFDAANGANDTWFFLGTKFTAVAMKGEMASGWTQRDTNVPDSNFAALINRRNPDYNPAVIRGGINCKVKTADVVRDLSKYLDVAGNVRFWAIELGTFDAWGGKADSADAFKKNLQIIIDSCKAHDILPVITQIPATNPQKISGKWQINKAFTDAVTDLVTTNDLIPGPDLYAYFLSNYGAMDLANDGYLPNQYGDFEMQREWNLKMDSVVYKAAAVAAEVPRAAVPVSDMQNAFSITAQGDQLCFTASMPGTVRMLSLDGKVVAMRSFAAGPVELHRSAVSGFCLLEIVSGGVKHVFPVMNY